MAVSLLPSALADILLDSETIAEGIALADASTHASLRIRAREAIADRYKVPRGVRLFGSSVKTEKGTARGVSTIVCYLLPGKLCPNHTARCLGACLGLKSGLMITPTVRYAQRWKSALLESDPVVFVALLAKEIRAHTKRAKREGTIPAVRIDGASDTGIGQALASAFPSARFYDYTKSLPRALRAAREDRTNYRLVFSYSGENAAEARTVLRAGGSVAVVFAVMPKSERFGRGSALPRGRFDGFPIVDGDEHDARFLDRKGGIVVALSLKSGEGSFADAVKRAGPFAVDPTAVGFA